MKKIFKKLRNKFDNWIINLAIDWDKEDNKRWDI
jgi:hypothetical protein